MNRILKVTCPKPVGEHTGVYVESWGMVFHNSPGKGEHLSSLEDFGPRDKIKVQEISDVDPDVVMARINQILIKPGKYSLLENNCDHSFNKVIKGRFESPQLKAAGGGLLALSVILILILAARKAA